MMYTCMYMYVHVHVHVHIHILKVRSVSDDYCNCAYGVSGTGDDVMK